jgi:hypothetical protein
MRELLRKARERFGSDAARYKTRDELLEALGLTDLGGVEQPASTSTSTSTSTQSLPLVLRDFFLSDEP